MSKSFDTLFIKNDTIEGNYSRLFPNLTISGATTEGIYNYVLDFCTFFLVITILLSHQVANAVCGDTLASKLSQKAAVERISFLYKKHLFHKK